MICIPIEVPRSDILPTRCINLVRSIAVNNLECSGGPIEQINQISHWFDASNIYGSVPSVQAQVIRFFSIVFIKIQKRFLIYLFL